MDKIRRLLIDLQNGISRESNYMNIRKIIQEELMDVAKVSTTFTTHGERGHEYIHVMRLYGVQTSMKITAKGGTQESSFFNEDWTTNLSMKGWDGSHGKWFESQLCHLNLLSS